VRARLAGGTVDGRNRAVGGERLARVLVGVDQFRVERVDAQDD
jgi:hypothetical protein